MLVKGLSKNMHTRQKSKTTKRMEIEYVKWSYLWTPILPYVILFPICLILFFLLLLKFSLVNILKAKGFTLLFSKHYRLMIQLLFKT